MSEFLLLQRVVTIYHLWILILAALYSLVLLPLFRWATIGMQEMELLGYLYPEGRTRIIYFLSNPLFLMTSGTLVLVVIGKLYIDSFWFMSVRPD